MASLTKTQKRYIWLAGSFPKLVVVQGRGCRSARLKYAVDEDGQRLVIFGYSNPLMWLEGRGLFRKLQSGAFTLTDLGEAAFRKMLIRGDGAELNEQISEARLARRAA